MSKLPDKANLHPTEIAEFLDVHVATVYRLIEARKIPVKQICGGERPLYRIPRAEFLIWYESQTVSHGE